MNCKRLYFNKCELSEFAYQIKPNEFWTCFKFQARGPNSLHCTWLLARLSNKVLSRRQEILEKSNNVMTMFITFTVRPGCTSAQHQTLVRPTERKPFFSWQRFAPARCYHFTGIFSPNNKKITHLYICVRVCLYICVYVCYVSTHTHIYMCTCIYTHTWKQTKPSIYTDIFVLLKRKMEVLFGSKKESTIN